MNLTPRQRSLRTWTLTALLGACIVAASPARAATYTWDPSGNRSDAAGSGTWNTTLPIWDNGTADVPWTNNVGAFNYAIFNGADGAYTVTVGAITADNVIFNTSGYTLIGASAASPGTLTLSSFSTPLPGLTVAVGKTLNIDANMTVSGPDYVNSTGGGAITPAGTINVGNGGKLVPDTFSYIGGTLNIGANGTVGSNTIQPNINGATVAVNGANASFTARGVVVKDSTVTVTQGTFNINAISNSSDTITNSTINLNGGLFVLAGGTSSDAASTYRFNGGTVQITGGGSATTGLTGKFLVQAGGAKFNLPSTGLTLASPLLHDAAGSAIDGGLTVDGTPNFPGAVGLTLKVAGTYTGGTTVSTGTLGVAADGALGTGDATVLSTAVSLLISAGVSNPFNNSTARLTLRGGGTVGTADNGFLNLASGANITVGSLVLGNTTYTSGLFSSTNFPEYFSGTGTLTVVPEPGSLALALAAASAFGFRRCRRARGRKRS